ncbi:hypothetical protein C8R45DRAFT_848205, partial [Mycena sanguinolenta]
FSCFPHIVNLACKTVLGAIANMDFAAPDTGDFVPLDAAAVNFLNAVERDPVATIRTTIRASSLWRQYFSEILKALQQKDLQLRDVDTRWSSTLLTVDPAVLLCEAIDKFLSDPQFRELHKYKLGDEDWKWPVLLSLNPVLVPHAFQQKLSAEKPSILGDALPHFEAMIKAWEKQQGKYPETVHIIQKGIDKLGAYRD